MNLHQKIADIREQIVLTKNAKNPFFKNDYLDLDGLIQALDPLLKKHGLLLSQPCEDNKVTTIIIETGSGEIFGPSSLTLPEINDPQKIGGAITYYRRYTLKSLLGLTEEDDDGNEASEAAAEALARYQQETQQK